MRRRTHFVRAGGLMLALIGQLALPIITRAQQPSHLNQTTTIQRTDVEATEDGSLSLAHNAAAAPAVYGSFKHFGLALSSPQQFTAPFSALRVDYQATTPAESQVRLDVRASADGVRWSDWDIGLARGEQASFDQSAVFAQYRVTLLSNATAGPTVSAINLTRWLAPRATAS